LNRGTTKTVIRNTPGLYVNVFLFGLHAYDAYPAWCLDLFKT
jgi:hypothetical protein